MHLKLAVHQSYFTSGPMEYWTSGQNLFTHKSSMVSINKNTIHHNTLAVTGCLYSTSDRIKIVGGLVVWTTKSAKVLWYMVARPTIINHVSINYTELYFC